MFPGMSADILTKCLKWAKKLVEDLDDNIYSRKDLIFFFFFPGR